MSPSISDALKHTLITYIYKYITKMSSRFETIISAEVVRVWIIAIPEVVRYNDTLLKYTDVVFAVTEDKAGMTGIFLQRGFEPRARTKESTLYIRSLAIFSIELYI